MKVRCISNRQEHLPLELTQDLGPGQVVFFPDELSVGEEYVVYAMIIRADQVWFYLCAGRGANIPYRYPSQAFELIDGHVSRTWLFSHVKGRTAAWYSLFAIPDWVQDSGFYGRLTDGDQEEVETFRRYRLLMDEESRAESSSEFPQDAAKNP